MELFLYRNKLKFSEIEKQLKIRSNKLAYHLKKLIHQGILEKQSETYFLSETAEYLIPYLSSKKTPLPVILIRIGNKKEVFLVKRKKRPYKDFLSLPGGRLLNNESTFSAAKRIMSEKYSIKIIPKKILSVALEHVKGKNSPLYSFILILIEAKAISPLTLTPLKENKGKIISSDYKLITQKFNLFFEINSREN